MHLDISILFKNNDRAIGPAIVIQSIVSVLGLAHLYEVTMPRVKEYLL